VVPLGVKNHTGLKDEASREILESQDEDSCCKEMRAS